MSTDTGSPDVEGTVESMNYGNNHQHSMAQRGQLTQDSSKSFTKTGDGCNAKVNTTCCEQLKEREEG